MSHFEPAQGVFIDNKETVSRDNTTRRDTNDIDRKMLRTLGQIADALQRYRAARRAASRATALAPSTSSPTTAQATALGLTGRPSSSLGTSARRGYKKMMSGNKFRAKECIIVQGERREQAQEKKKRKRRPRTSKRKRRKPLYNASSRADRAAAAAASSISNDNRANPGTDTGAIVASTSTPQPSRVNRTKSAQIALSCLEQKCAVVSLGVGTLKTRLREGLREHNLCPEQELPSQVKIVVDVVSEMVRVGTEITRCAEMACALYMAET
ncbi:hypothetical protein BGZ70_005660, partial [Mortierella alpina]